MMKYGVLIITSHATLGTNVKSCMENTKAKIGNAKEDLPRAEVKQVMLLLFLKDKEDLFNSIMRS